MHEVTARRSQSSPRRERVNSDAATLRLRRIALGGGEACTVPYGAGVAGLPSARLLMDYGFCPAENAPSIGVPPTSMQT